MAKEIRAIDAAFDKLSDYASADDDMAIIANFIYFIIEKTHKYGLATLKDMYEKEREDDE